MIKSMFLAALTLVFASVALAQTATVTCPVSTYSAAGGNVTISVTLNYTGTMSALGASVGSVPSGWTYGLTGGSQVPAIAPSTGATDNFDFSYLSIPASPVSFNFTVSYPAGLAGDQTFSSISAIFRPTGESPQTVNLPNIVLTPAHPAITSATSASAVVNTSFSYTITASESPTSYSATGLPAGLSLDSNTGLISGTPTSAGTYTIGLSASNRNGAGSTVNLVLTVGSLPDITSSLTASGTAGTAFSYTITASNFPTSFNVGTLPGGLNVDTGSGIISGTPASAGTTNVSLSATNDLGTGSAVTLVITIAPGVSTGPTITTQPQSQTVPQGGNVTFSVGATGATSYQWRKDGNVLSGATGSSITLPNVGSGDAGSYTVIVSDGSHSVSSNAAVLAVTVIAGAPTITTQPVSQSLGAGETAIFTVNATGAGLSYQWRKNGSPIAGATGASFTLPGVSSSMEGDYSVVVTNSGGSTTSNAATLTVHGVSFFGTFANNAGTFALFIRPDRTGVFLGYARNSNILLVSQDITVDDRGHFSVTPTVSGATTTAAANVLAERMVAEAASPQYVIDGSIAGDGTISGTVSGLGLTMSAPAPSVSGSTSSLVGFYQSGAAGSSATSYTIIGAAGGAYVATATSSGVDAGTGTVASNGTIAVTTVNNATVAGTIGSNAAITLTETPAGSTTPTTYAGADSDGRSPERFVNISTRAFAGTGANVVIAGFVVNGSVPKHVLIRAVGPSLSLLGISSGYLTHPRLQLYDSKSVVIAENSGWSASPDAAAITTAGAKVGAFPLIAGSADAALILYIAPGNYTAMVSGTDDATGITLVEVYEVP